MDKFIINGGKKLEGEIEISGAKNEALPLTVASILSNEVSTIRNVSNLADLRSMISLLKVLGVKAELNDTVLRLDPSKCDGYEAPYDLVRKMRASIYVLGALLGRLGRAKVSFPGGCVIGTRPVDLHLMGLEKLGAKISIEHGYIIAEADKLVGTEIYLAGIHGPSVGATVNVMLAAVKADGITTIKEASCEPQITELANFLNSMGAKIESAGTPVLTIHGVKELHGAEHEVIPDRIEAATYMIAGIITRGNLLIKNCIAQHLDPVIRKLQEIGVEVFCKDNCIRIIASDPLKPVDVRTAPFPGFPTDVQPLIMSLLATAPGISIITESIYPDRFIHVSELNRMGADIKIEGASAVVKGVPKLSGAPVMASELRGGAGLVLAGLAADKHTVVSRVYHIDRGYDGMEKKLASVGADIRRISE
ncbi:MAG: UDP-N-acetylglucosamine 1-carboxyvinyltransferase [Candidatus Poribacteria bacterium]|nr:UDP-N-acetylglucosamine 1-carboxyvinyltransferase [Candidatus Poribacteria bacterium]